MTTNSKRIVSALCAVLMLATAMSGCKKSTSDDSRYSVIEVIEDYGDDTTESNNSNTSGNDNAANSTGSNASQGNHTSGSGNNATGEVNPADYKGKTVQYATWQYADGIDTDGAIAKFKKKYGIKVQLVTVPQSTYVQEITSLINAGKAPDVIRDWEYWPSFLSIAQPLENAKINLSDPIWDQNSIKNREVNGKHYSLVSIGGLFSAPGNVVYYNKKLLNSNGIKTPEDYKNIGKWNFDAFYQIMKSVAAIGNGYYGAYIDNFGGRIANSFGTDIYKYSNGKFSSGLSDPMLTTVWQMTTNWSKEGLLANDRSYFIDGKAGMAITDAYGLKKTGYWRDMSFKDIGYIEMPELNGNKPTAPTTITLWGICKGAKNPVAGGIFLRYYLDINNYDINKEFISADAANYAVKMSTNSQYSDFSRAQTGVCDVNGIDKKKYYRELFEMDPSQVSTYFQSISNEVDSYIKATQKVLDTNAQ